MINYDRVSVFLSYPHEDEESILIIKNALLNMGLRKKHIFRDKDNIKPGDDWLEKIIEAIEDANACFFLWTNNIKEDSEIIRSERERAHKLMTEFSFLNLGLSDDKSPRPYYVIDIVGEILNESLARRLERYKKIQQIRFKSKKELLKTIEARFKEEVSPVLQKAQIEQERFQGTGRDVIQHPHRGILRGNTILHN